MMGIGGTERETKTETKRDCRQVDECLCLYAWHSNDRAKEKVKGDSSNKW